MPFGAHDIMRAYTMMHRFFVIYKVIYSLRHEGSKFTMLPRYNESVKWAWASVNLANHRSMEAHVMYVSNLHTSVCAGSESVTVYRGHFCIC